MRKLFPQLRALFSVQKNSLLHEFRSRSTPKYIQTCFINRPLCSSMTLATYSNFREKLCTVGMIHQLIPCT